MTAEITLMNRNGIALAADSAVSIPHGNSHKIYNSANKLFALSKTHPVGIMVYGSSDFMRVPWETIIKMYRNQLDGLKFPTLKEYCSHFIEALDSRYVTTAAEVSMIKSLLIKYLNEIFDVTNEAMSEKFVESFPSDEERLYELHRVIKSYQTKMDDLESLIPENENFEMEFKEKYSDDVKKVIDYLIGLDPVTDELIEDIINFTYSILVKDTFSTDEYAGVVIAGFGEEEVYPSQIAYQIKGFVNGKLLYKVQNESEIGSDNTMNQSTAIIIPYAQQEMVHSFVEGITPELKETIFESLHKILTVYPDLLKANLNKKGIQDSELSPEIVETMVELGQEIIGNFQSEIDQELTDRYVFPLLNILDILPKEELASMAKALVNLTSLKRKVTIDAETVGGPIDVAVISKGDGFIWIERKHYFKPELNYHFFQNYMRGGEYEEGR